MFLYFTYIYLFSMRKSRFFLNAADTRTEIFSYRAASLLINITRENREYIGFHKKMSLIFKSIKFSNISNAVTFY